MISQNMVEPNCSRLTGYASDQEKCMIESAKRSLVSRCPIVDNRRYHKYALFLR